MTDKEQIQSLYESMYRAMIAKDTMALGGFRWILNFGRLAGNGLSLIAGHLHIESGKIDNQRNLP